MGWGGVRVHADWFPVEVRESDRVQSFDAPVEQAAIDRVRAANPGK
jgi:hypothetical protein